MCSEVVESGRLSPDEPVDFKGKFPLVIDDKSRLTIAAAYRKFLGDKVVLHKTEHRDLNLKYIEILFPSTWRSYMETLNNVSQTDPKLRRYIQRESAKALDISIDKQGRILIPQDMRQHAGIESSNVVLTGAFDRLALWSPDNWAVFERESEEEDLEAGVYEKYRI